RANIYHFNEEPLLKVKTTQHQRMPGQHLPPPKTTLTQVQRWQGKHLPLQRLTHLTKIIQGNYVLVSIARNLWTTQAILSSPRKVRLNQYDNEIELGDQKLASWDELCALKIDLT